MAALSRRDMLFGPFRKARVAASPTAPVPSPPQDANSVAVIMGRHCLAFRHVTCSTCYERCPEPGAIVRERGIPRVNPDACTGCRVCHDVCPAPTNAVLMIAGRPTPQRPASK